MAPSPVRNDEVNLLSLIRERVKTRKFKGRMTRKCGGISDIQYCDQHQLSTRRTTVLHQQDVVAPLCPAGGSDLISREGTRYAELLGLITSDHATLQRLRLTKEFGLYGEQITCGVCVWTSVIVRGLQNLLRTDRQVLPLWTTTLTCQRQWRL
jgi:hypothetical protein